MAIYLHDITLRTEEEENTFLNLANPGLKSAYPFGLFTEKGLGRIDFDPVTIFYGGNGSGKSTLLNIIATRIQALREIPNRPGPRFEWYVNGVTRKVYTDYKDYTVHVEPLTINERFPKEWKGIPPESRILTSEDIFDKTLTLRGRNREIDRHREMVAQTWWASNVEGKNMNWQSKDSPAFEAWKLQRSMKGKSMSRVIKEQVGFNVKTGSNGENAFEFFLEKIQEGVLYLLDEPENSLSAKWQVKLASYLEGMAHFENCQFIIATHSPFLLGIRGAKIYDLDTSGVPVRKWTELENVREYYNFFKAHEGEFV